MVFYDLGWCIDGDSFTAYSVRHESPRDAWREFWRLIRLEGVGSAACWRSSKVEDSGRFDELCMIEWHDVRSWSAKCGFAEAGIEWRPDGDRHARNGWQAYLAKERLYRDQQANKEQQPNPTA